MKKNIDDNNVRFDSNELKPRRWLLYVLVIVEIIILIVLATKFINDREEKEKENKNIFDIFNIFDFDSISDGLGTSTFNSKFEMYLGTNGELFANKLIDNIVTNNKTNSEHVITVIFDDVTTITPNEIQGLKSKINSNNDYEITANYDENGYINEIEIKKIISEFDVNFFNNEFEMYSGTKYGSQVAYLLDSVITSNKKNTDHIIEVVFDSTKTNSQDEIRNFKKKLDDWTKYEVVLDYDSDGYICKITIER